MNQKTEKTTNQPQNQYRPITEFVPIYEKLRVRYRQDILDRRLRPGDQIDSITALQQKHNVSRETAKKVLRLLAEEGLIVQRAGKGSFVADLRPKQKVWGVVLPFYSMQYEDLLVRISNNAVARGREIRHVCDYNNWQEEIRLVGEMLNERYEAILVIPTLDESKTGDFYTRLSPQDSPVILLDHTLTGNDFPCVIQSYDLGVFRAMNYLRGKKNGGIAFVRDQFWGSRNMIQELMEETYLDFLDKYCPQASPLILDRAEQLHSNHLISANITGIFCCNDISAVQILGKFKERGINIPHEINLVSYGNTHLAQYFTPAITSIDPHHEEMVQHLLDLLEPELKDGRVEKRQFIIQPDLIARET